VVPAERMKLAVVSGVRMRLVGVCLARGGYCGACINYSGFILCLAEVSSSGRTAYNFRVMV
jgi:hypothetical protein